jgi:uncharacterized MAPEG superfamily protein
MTIELTMLVYVVLVLFAVIAIGATVRVLEVGLPAAAGPRDELPDPGRFCARAERTANNHIQGVALFAPLVLAVQAAGLNNEVTALAVQIYLGARIAHAALYLLGVPWLRTIAFIVGVIALGMLVFVLLV